MRNCVLKQFRQKSACQIVLLCAMVLTFAAGSAYAEDHFWSSAGGGSFNFWLNWVPDYVPGADDRAIFELDMDPAYEVTFYESVTNQECIFRTDKVIMDLGGFTYTLTNPGFGLTVGDDLGNVAEVLFYHGTLDTTVTHVGLWEGSAGTLDLESGLTLNATDRLVVSNDGDGLLTVHSGASVIAKFASIGVHDFGNTGVLSVDGASAEFTVNETIRVGDEGYGILNLLNGATAHSLNGYIGDSFTGYGEINITGASEMTADEWLTFGSRGSGQLTVAQASQLNVVDLRFGGESGAEGHADLLDADSRIDASAYIFVGDQGLGTMNVSGQAAMTAETVLVGAGGTGEGELNILDAGTTLTVQNNLVSGQYGVGTINITNGADVRTTEPSGWIFVGQVAGSDGYLLVDGGSALTAVQAPLVVGASGSAGMDILGGSEVHTSGELFMGWDADSFGQLTISGAGSKYISDSGYSAQVGDGGEGTLIISDGGHLEKPGGFRIGLQSTGVGTVTLSGSASTFKCGEHLGVGEYGVGTFTLNDGRAAVGDVDLADVPSGEVHVGDWGRLTGTGTLIGNVINFNGGSVRPGGDPAETQTGVFTIDGDYTQQDAWLLIRIRGLLPGDEYSVLNVTGTASLDGMLEIVPVEGFIPRAGQQFTVMTFASRTGEFAGVSDPRRYEVTYSPTDVVVTVLDVTGDLDDDGDVDIADFASFADCMNGPDVAYPQGCDASDLDIDSDVDLADFAELQTLFGTGL